LVPSGVFWLILRVKTFPSRDSDVSAVSKRVPSAFRNADSKVLASTRCRTVSLCSMTSTTLNGFGLEPQWDFSTFRYQLPEKLAVCPAQTPSATERNVGTNHERILMAGFLLRLS